MVYIIKITWRYISKLKSQNKDDINNIFLIESSEWFPQVTTKNYLSNLTPKNYVKKPLPWFLRKKKNIIYQINAFPVMSLLSVTAKTSWIINASVGSTEFRGRPKRRERRRRLASARFLLASIDALAHLHYELFKNWHEMAYGSFFKMKGARLRTVTAWRIHWSTAFYVP